MYSLHSPKNIWFLPQQARSGTLVFGLLKSPSLVPLIAAKFPPPQSPCNLPSTVLSANSESTTPKTSCLPLIVYLFNLVSSIQPLSHSTCRIPFALPSQPSTHFGFVSSKGKPCSCAFAWITAFLPFAAMPLSFRCWTNSAFVNCLVTVSPSINLSCHFASLSDSSIQKGPLSPGSNIIDWTSPGWSLGEWGTKVTILLLDCCIPQFLLGSSVAFAHIFNIEAILPLSIMATGVIKERESRIGGIEPSQHPCSLPIGEPCADKSNIRRNLRRTQTLWQMVTW